jgi:hypothetical protein
MVTVGSHGIYEWLVANQDLSTLLRKCPEVVIGKYVAITSLDSGPVLLKEREIAAGWESSGKIAYSPQVHEIENLPRQWYDEWYVFTDPINLGQSHIGENVFEVPQEKGHVCVFVNFGGFSLDSREMEDLATLFWSQLDLLRPESYIADGDFFNFVSANRPLFASVRNALVELG